MTAPLIPATGGAGLRVGIIDDTDAPEAKMLAIAIGEPGSARVEYLSRCRRPLKGRDFDLGLWTDATMFGVEVSLAMDGVLRVEQIGESRATYSDGLPRRWQGPRQAEINLRTVCVPAVVRFLRQARAASIPVREVGT